MFNQPMHKKMLKQSLLWFAFACLLVFSLVACGTSSGSGPAATATPPRDAITDDDAHPCDAITNDDTITNSTIQGDEY